MVRRKNLPIGTMSGIAQVRYESITHHIFLNETMLFSILRRECKILNLATEILDDICWIAGRANILSLGLVCKRMQPITARILYRRPTIDDRNVHSFLSVISSSSKSSLDYGSLINSLTLRIVENRTMDIYPLLCQAFAQMTGLVSLTLSIPSSLSDPLLQQMRSMSIVRRSTPFFSNISARLACTSRTHIIPGLPTLSRLSIRGDISLVDIAEYREITSLELLVPMRILDVLHVVAKLTLKIAPNQAMRHLALDLDTDRRDDTRWVFVAISDAMPNLESFEIFSLNDDPLVCSLSINVSSSNSSKSPGALRIPFGEPQYISQS